MVTAARRLTCALGLALVSVACGGSDGGVDAAFHDASVGATDAAVLDAPVPRADAAPTDANDGGSAGSDGAPSDALSEDAAEPDAIGPDAIGPDASRPDAGHTTEHVHIYIDNFCNVSTSPTEITVPSGGSVNIQWHNHSVDYEADVWMSYGGGYLELARGGTWSETYEWCAGVAVFTGTADIGPAGVSNSVCPHVYFPIRCL